ncbi:MAG: OsmC family peroxiredoxin [Deltaproteobacteria bacterium]|nr:OsmC family peroxiredoxin [Deltaproteobacteria bacterium]
MATSHEFTARLDWQQGGEGVAWGNHVVQLDGRPSFEVSAAPAYRGDPSRLNPEELFLVAIASCQMLTFLSLASRKGVSVRTYHDEATATLALVDGRMRIRSVTLRPHIAIEPAMSNEEAQRLVESAHRGCFIANSVSCEVLIEPTIS